MTFDDVMPVAVAGPVPRRLVNLRDVGGADPALRRGVLLRSDAPHSDDEPPFVGVPWPPATVVDLRDDREKRESHPLARSGRVVDLPLMDGGARNAASPASLGALYRGMLEGHSAGILVEVVRVLALADGPVLVHCTAGKDRTGVVVALALRLLGVSRTAVVADYRLTDAAMPRVFARIPVTVANGLAGASTAIAPEFGRAPAHAIGEFLDALDAHAGGADGWFRHRGGDAAIVDALQERMRLRAAASGSRVAE